MAQTKNLGFDELSPEFKKARYETYAKECEKAKIKPASFEEFCKNKGMKPKDSKPKSGFIQCAKCKKMKAVRPDVYAKRIKKFGSEEKLIAGYLCLKCRGEKDAKK